MKNKKLNGSGIIWAGMAFVLWLIINIRVEAGMGTPFERAVDGLVGGAVLLIAVFLTLRFFQCSRLGCGKGKSCLKQEESY
ncbi:MAG: hypothetical protein SCH71_02970 [Desulfobulbaceae bacterium]|nr:hypothetical protein [Desulfobulbaceae bacterium]